MTEITSVKQRFGIIGTSELLDRALEVALRVAPTDLTVLVTGESGVGKEFFRRSFTPIRRASTTSTSPSIVRPYPREPSIPSFSATRRGPSPAPPRPVRAILRRPTAARSSSTRWPSCRIRPRRGCCVCCRRASSSASDRRRSRRPTSASWLPRTSICRRPSPRAASAKTSTTAWVRSPSACRRCASGPRTSRCCSASSPPMWPCSTACRP